MATKRPRTARPKEADKWGFVLHQAEMELQSIIDAYDQIVGKAYTLLSVSLPLFTGLIAAAVTSYDRALPSLADNWRFLFLAYYALWLLPCVVVLIVTVWRSRTFVCGDYPGYFLDKPDILKNSMTVLNREQARRYRMYIDENRTFKAGKSVLLRTALLLFVVAPLLAGGSMVSAILCLLDRPEPIFVLGRLLSLALTPL